MKSASTRGHKPTVFRSIAWLLVPLAAIVAFSCCKQVDAGHAGVRLWWGRIVSKPFGAGLWFYCPIGGSIVTYDCREQRANIAMESYTKDVQSAKMQTIVTYGLSASKIDELHNTVGSQYFDRIVIPIVLGATKDVIGQWEADKLINGREQATRDIYAAIVRQLENSPIRITSFVIGNIEFSEVFEKAIEDKQVAMQMAIRAKNRTQEVEEEARQRVISAEADAKAMQIRGDALRANPGLIQLQAVDKWDGQAPDTLVIGTDPSTILSIGSK